MVAFPTFTKVRQQLGFGRVVDNKPMSFEPKGTSGTEIFSGYFDEEYLSKLLAEKGIEVFDEMRRSDGAVKMLLSVVKNPIKSASWTVEPTDESSEEEKEIAAFVEHILFHDMATKSGKRKTFMDFIGEALTCVEFGFSVFEIVHKVVKGHKRFGDYLGIADLGFRHQRSILEWKLEKDGTINHVRQLVHGDLGVEALIPGQHLLVFSIEKEGDNYQGISMLRPCYGAWFRKNIYRKLQAIGIERAAKGVPIGTIPTEMLARKDYDDQRKSFQNLIDKLSAHEKNGIVLGAGFDIKELKLSHDADKVQTTINGENSEMAFAFVANFMMLGMGGNSGSFALGTDLSAIFLAGIQNIGYAMCEKINLQIVQPLVRAKYGERDKYPSLCVSGISDKAGTAMADNLQKLISAGAVQKSPGLQKHVHKLYDLPDIDEDIAAHDQDNARAVNEALKNPQPPQGKNPKTQDDKKKLHANCEHDHSIRLTDAQKASHPVSEFIESRADMLALVMRSGLRERAMTMLHDMSKLIRAGGEEIEIRRAVLEVVLPESKQYTQDLRAWAGETAQQAMIDVLAELGKARKGFKFSDNLKKLTKEAREKIVQTLLLTAGYQDGDLEKAAYFSFNENFGRADTETVISVMEQSIERSFEKNLIETAALNMAAKVTNAVRGEVFFAPGVLDEVESFVFSNPAPESDICRALVGRVFTKEEYHSSANIPPLHHNCKSYIIAQTVGASGNKPLTSGGLTVTDPETLKTKTL